MRRIVAELALSSGRPQRQIVKDYSLRELSELSVLKQMQHYETSKEDARHAIQISAILGVSGNKHDPKKFIPNWRPKTTYSMTKEEIVKRSKAAWLPLIERAQRKKKNG